MRNKSTYLEILMNSKRANDGKKNNDREIDEAVKRYKSMKRRAPKFIY